MRLLLLQAPGALDEFGNLNWVASCMYDAVHE